MRKLLTSLLALPLAISSMAETGTYGFTALDLPFSAFSVASGQENISSHRDELGLSQKNPALLQPESEDKSSAQLSFVKQVASANSFSGSYLKGVDDKQIWSAYFNGLTYGSMDETDQYGTKVGKFSCFDLVFGGNYSRKLADHLTAGIGLKFLYSQIADYKAFGFAFDLGANYYNPDNNLSLSLAARNIGVQLATYTESDNSRDRLPFNLDFGVSKKLEHAPIVFHYTYHDINRWDLSYYKSGYTEKSQIDEAHLNEPIEVKWGDMFFRHMVFGLDFCPVETFAVTASYNFRRNREFMLVDTKTGAGWGFGLTVDVRKVKVQAGYSISGRAANTFGLAMTYKIGDGIKRVEFQKLY
ncbi:MAG: type IX secretion system protein PorQ [Paludibacteraceae bacterium]|nr:type IX secretion system protein PorQ [Paludibacteraceae bacterium]